MADRGAMRETLRIVSTGMAMGVAEVIPGVSGGTIALVAGIYDRLIGAIASLHPRALRHLPRVHTASGRRAFAAELREMDVPFLLALGIGMAAMVVTLARGIEHVLVAYPGLTYAFFGGLILASAWLLYGHVALDTPARLGLAALAAVVAFVLSGFAADGVGHALPVVFVAGAVAVTALVLPGVSGSFLLVAMGQYEYMVGTLNAFVDMLLAAAGLTDASVDPLEVTPPVVVFLLGATLGVLTVARAVDRALDRAREATLIVLISLMVGGLRVPVAEVLDATREPIWWWVAIAGSAVAGAVVIVAFDRATGEVAY
ncbi:MAG: DUF368 domain-containing protein [Halobacteriales archaeon]